MTLLRMPSRLNRSTTYLVAFIVLAVGSNLLWTSHAIDTSQQQARHAIVVGQQQARAATKAAIDANNRQWCDSLGLITSGPAPTSKQPGLTKLYDDFGKLETKFGCKGSQ